MMSCPNATTTIMRSVSSEKTEYIADSSTNTLEIQLNNQRSRSSSDGPVGIFWDIENCPVPSSVRPEDVGVNIRMAVTVHPVIRGAVTMFNAYGDFTYFTKRIREGCQRTGVKLVDVPNGRKDAADKAILVDMFLFALDNPTPSTIMLISGDVDFAPALHILGQRGYTVILVVPQGSVSSALCNAGKFLWDWPSVAHGEGFVPPARASMPPRVGPSEVGPSYLMGCQVNNENFQNEEDHIVYKGLSQGYHSSRDWSVMPCSVSGYNNSSSTPFYPCEQSDFGSWAPPRDLNGLKRQLVKLLEISGGVLYLNRVPAEYLRLYGKPLFVSDFGVFKLANLFNKMGDAMTVMGKGKKQFVCLVQERMCPSAPPLILARNDHGKGKATQEEVIMGNNTSSDELSDEGRAVAIGADLLGASNDEMLEQFKYELLEIMVSYSCQIFLDLFEGLYQQRYKKPLDYRRFGVVRVEELFEKFGDVVAIRQDPRSEKFFLCPVGRG